MVGMVLLAFLGLTNAPLQHWTQTARETVWRGQYKNCDKGWAVNLPPEVVAHGSLRPNPNHGFLISAGAPDTTAEVTLKTERAIGIYDSYDSMGFGSPRAYLDGQTRGAGHIAVIQRSDITLQKLPAAYIHYRSQDEGTSIENEEFVAYRGGPKNGSLIIYVVWLRTPSQHYVQDRKLFMKVRDGFYLLPIPKGECSDE